MKKYIFISFLLISSISYADNYYISDGEALLEIYEREQAKHERMRESYIRPVRERRERELKEKERAIEEMVKRY